MTDQLKARAGELLKQFKGEDYLHGLGCLDRAGAFCSGLGSTAMLVVSEPEADWAQGLIDTVKASLDSAGVGLAGGRIFAGARPNAPREDVYRIEAEILLHAPDFMIAMGGGSTIDAVKAANALACYGRITNNVEGYFGVGKVTALAEQSPPGRPVVAVQLAASSAAHLTKYSNITDPAVGQKKLIVDEAVVPEKALFDYSVTASSPRALTLDGALDGISHCLEVYYGAPNDATGVEDIALTGIELAIVGLKQFLADASSMESRESLGLATDLGGYAIMVGGTNGGHLTSFSLVDVLTHGRACALLNPYYTVFFAPAIEPQLRKISALYRKEGFMEKDPANLSGTALGKAVAGAMIELSRSAGFPTTLGEIEGFTDRHIERALTAAKNPQLDMKLKNMPVPLNASLIDEYMGPVLESARTGNLDTIRAFEDS